MQSVCVASASSAEYRNVGPAGPGWSNPGLYTSRMTVIKIGCCRRLVRDVKLPSKCGQIYNTTVKLYCDVLQNTRECFRCGAQGIFYKSELFSDTVFCLRSSLKIFRQEQCFPATRKEKSRYVLITSSTTASKTHGILPSSRVPWE
jgi:hypothetical protein